MKKALFYTLTLIIPVLLLLSFPAWPVPGLINYQGKLTDPNGVSLNGSYIMKFYLYNTESNGSLLWNEQQDATVTDGIYNVELGKISSFPSGLFDNENLYLEVKISGSGMDWETLSPRQRLTSTPFAMKAGYATTAGNTDMVDGFQGSELEESAEINNKIAIHVQDASAHHTKTTSFTELTDMATDDQIPDDITVNYAKDADKVDGKHASEFGDGHSLDAADGNPTNAVYVDNAGNVGIGTTEPTAILDVAGNAQANSFIAGATTSYADGSITMSGPTTTLGIMGGNVGIGTLVPEYALHIAKSGNTGLLIESSSSGYPTTGSTSNSGILFGNPDHEWYVGGDYHNTKLRIDYDEQNRILIDANGNVGIGTLVPEYALHIAKSGNTGLLIESSSSGYPTTGSTSNSGILFGNPDHEWYVGGDYHNTKLRIDYDEQNRILIDANGNVGIGTTSPQQKMHISGVMRLEPQSSPPSGALGDLYVGTDGKLYFHNGTQWKEVSLI